MSPEDLRKLRERFPISESVARINSAQDCGGAPSSKPEQAIRHDSLEEASGEKGNGPRFRVVIVSFRRRLIDPDNLCGKYFVDCLRRWKAIPDDTAAIIEYAIRQEKVFHKEDERTEITVTPI